MKGQRRNRKLWLTYTLKRYFTQTECRRFICNICGQYCTSPLSDICGRETPSCYHCGSTLRFRSIIHVLSLELFGRSYPISKFPAYPSKSGMGMSDSEVYSIPLQRALHYQNMFYHKQPKLDILAITPDMENSFDFIISSEIFEHIPPPVEIAFQNLYALLKPGGVCIFSVPYVKDGLTKEHFPDLFDYKIIDKNGRKVLINKDKDGVEKIYTNGRFHGGKGSTLEMRVFSESSLLDNLSKAGFKDIRIHDHNKPEYGIIWRLNRSFPISMKK